VNPFFHSFGYKAGWLAAIISGATILPVAKFDKRSVLETIERDKVTMLPGAPSLYEMLLNAPERGDYDLSSLRLGVTGAASVPVQLVRDMRDILGFETVVTAYGLTESTGVVSICRPEDEPETIASTSGRAIEGVELICANPNTGEEVPRGSEGEVWLRGYNVMQGYFDMPEATAEAITADGWLKTGDIGVMDERGYLRITDRLKDMYIMNGENVYPAEVEKVLYGLPGVAQVAVIGVAKAPQGEVGMAFVVKKTASDLSAQAVSEYCGQQLARYKCPFYVEFVEALPLNASGKVLKTELKALAVGLLGGKKQNS
jgi:acyl-CoA synthetase (AMP-forming)/AMP-acid ligase II